jgi:hypothetical protein
MRRRHTYTVQTRIEGDLLSLWKKEKAVSENYIGSKKADVICTEDKFGNLVMLPSNEVGQWAELEGEIRPSGPSVLPWL